MQDESSLGQERASLDARRQKRTVGDDRSLYGRSIVAINEATDEQLLISIQAGDELAFAEFYRRHSRRVFVYLKKRLGSAADIEEVLQIVFMQLYRKRHQYRPEFKAMQWVYVIAKSELRDFVNREKKHQQSHLHSEEILANLSQNDGDAPSDKRVAADFLGAHLAGLKPEQVRALEMRYQEGESFAAIAQALATSESNARQLVSRAVRWLKSKHLGLAPLEKKTEEKS